MLANVWHTRQAGSVCAMAIVVQGVCSVECEEMLRPTDELRVITVNARVGDVYVHIGSGACHLYRRQWPRYCKQMADPDCIFTRAKMF